MQTNSQLCPRPRGLLLLIALPMFIELLGFVPASVAQDVTFSKTKAVVCCYDFRSAKLPLEINVDLSITDSKVLIKGKPGAKKLSAIDLEIPYSAIDTMSYEATSHHRNLGLLGVVSPATGLAAASTKSVSYWLVIDYHEGDTKQSIDLQLDKSEYENVITALEAKTGKHIYVLDSKASQFDSLAGTKDVDEVIPFGVDKVAAALKDAMEGQGCKVTQVTSSRIECKLTGAGGEQVTATLEAKGEQTQVRIWTGQEFTEQPKKRNWSTPIYQEMMKSLKRPTGSENLPPGMF